MTSLLSAISGQFTRSIILGTFFPTALFVLLNLLLLGPYVPHSWPPLQAIRQLGAEWRTVVATGLTVLFAGLLYALNTPLIRFYEGYPWKDSWIGKFFVGRQKARFRRSSAQWAAMRVLIDTITDARSDDERLPALNALRTRLGLRMNNDFPSRETSILPTRLGNVIRSAEDYPNRQYGIAAITMWPRLVAVIDKEFAAGLEEAKTSMDLMLNASTMSAASAALLTVLGLASPAVWAGQWLLWLGQVIVLAGASYVFYRGSIGPAAMWGMSVRAAFDLYRGNLLKGLGFQQQPEDFVKERELWMAISQQIVYGDPPAHLRAPMRYSDAGTFVRARPGNLPLELARSATPSGDVVVVVRNRSADRTAADVVVTDTVPAGKTLVHGSARVDAKHLHPTGSNPYWFVIGQLPPGAERTLTFRVA